ncbi:MAG: septal ring lytic transglycosylase RlpA family protein [Deltaproteobacteria bacterium]
MKRHTHLLSFEILSALLLCMVMQLAGCGKKAGPPPAGLPAPQKPPSKAVIPPTQRPYTINGKTYYPLPSAEGFVEEGLASWYGPDFHGRPTANGERYDMYSVSAAHKILPMNTYVRVTNLDNGRETVVRINDRGPFVKDRIIDLSYGAAKQLGVTGPGLARVRIEALGEVDMTGDTPAFLPHPELTRGPFYVQVGAFLDPKNAQAYKAQLEEKFENVVVLPHVVGYQTFHRVQIFASNDYRKAREFEAYAERNVNPGAFLVAR